MSKTKRAKQWPRIYKVTHRSGQATYQVDLGIVEGKRKRPYFATMPEAETFAEQSRVARANEGVAAFTLPLAIRMDASKAHQILAPHDISILEAAKHYQKHVLAYKTAPPVAEVVKQYVDDAKSRNLRPDTVKDLNSRLTTFAADFGDSRLSDITLDELKEWIQDEEWEMRTRINYLTKISQLYGYALRHKWADSNLTEHIDRPAVDETTPEIFSVEQTERLLTHAQEFNLLPYIAIGLFAGVRSAEMMRLNGKNINFEGKTLTIGADIAKKRSQRIIDMQPALLAWLNSVKEQLEDGGPIADANNFRKNKAGLLEAAEIADWPANGLRHSFGSYHYAMFRSVDETANQMGNSVDMVHKHYKTLVSRSEAEKFWKLRPQSPLPNAFEEVPQPEDSAMPTTAKVN